MYSEHIFLRYRWQLVCNERMGIHTSPQQLSVFKGLAELDCGKLSTLDWYSDKYQFRGILSHTKNIRSF